MSIPGLAVLLVVLAAGERALRWARRRKGIHQPVTAAGVEQFDTLFTGGKAIELDERLSQSMMRDDEEEGATPNSPVNLDSGTIRLTPR
ncbi:DUF6191 domain-containing protein [Actinosynnema sp. NPDC020468]|uniref:DUF6191 domain-containing protein n=1 Tax=Actinosynnema sp. NPDC020468 TaxID=3154488 RepID=UPI003401C2A0